MIAIDTLIIWAGNGLILLGAFFVLTGALGILRMPDFFSRLHPAGVTDSLGVTFIIFGLILHTGFTLTSAKLLLLMLFILLTSPTACHALAKSAFLSGMADEDIKKLKHAKSGESVKRTTNSKKDKSS
ncbi:MAG: monovalent cation/H(+) antiporter subunit G [Alphaproteobacteria bacterium]|nr:monovalent cation/H(+) antiporter subunit G [Alphaproteobacteria bacterium]